MSYVPSPAGFWKSYVAYFVDVLIVGTVVNVLASIVLVAASVSLPPLPELLRQSMEDPDAALQALLPIVAWTSVVSTLLYVAIAGAYFIGMEASSWQATLGKRLAGIRVTALDGGKPGLGQVAGRFVAASLSWLTLNLGHALAAWTPERRALHDYLAGTRVENADRTRTAMPAWGWAVIALNVLLLLGSIFAVVAAAWFVASQQLP